MNPLIQLKTTRNSRRAGLCCAFAHSACGQSATGRGYPANTAEGIDAPAAHQRGLQYAVGFNALFNDTTGQLNTAMGESSPYQQRSQTQPPVLMGLLPTASNDIHANRRNGKIL